MSMGGLEGRGEYRSVYCVLLDDAGYQALTPNARLMLLTLKFTRMNNAAGIFLSYVEPLQRQTGLSFPAVRTALEELEAGGWIAREQDVIWIINHLRYDPSKPLNDPKKRKWVQRVLSGLPSLGVVRGFAETYGLDVDERWPAWNPSPRKPPVEQQEIEGVGIRKSKSVPRPKADVGMRAEFEAFWLDYPRRTAKPRAWESWQRKRPPLDACRAAIKWQKETEQWQKGIIPHPATWINQGRWTDEPHGAGVSRRLVRAKTKAEILGMTEEELAEVEQRGRRDG